ncbi:MAG: S4 domain-containing protein [Patescibacteria group bacterium]|nr:S4 domain-containing protein [Patescibacteria group bacterium]
MVQKGETPESVKVIKIISNINIIDLLVNNKITDSRSAAKRLIEQGGVELDGKKVTNPREILNLKNDIILKVGKRGFYKLTK